MDLNKKPNYSLSQLSNCIKILSADAIEQAKSGHPGLPLGFSDVMTSLAFNFLKFNPHDPQWFNRDRLILSAGHGSMLLYSFFYLTGYKDFGLEDIKNFRQIGAKTAGHPEHHLYEGIETTTGPLGQGLANAVGMAIAGKKYQQYLGKDICDYKIYVIVGDGCLMEGISYEASSLAGHLNLNNLVILFDDNGISIDGKTNLTISENHLQKFDSMGFNICSADGHNPDEICNVLSKVQDCSKPSFIAFKTIIGKGTKYKADSEKAHGSPLGQGEIEYLKSCANFSKESFCIPEELKQLWREAWLRNKKAYTQWQKNFAALTEEKKIYLVDKPLKFPKTMQSSYQDEATRVSSGKILQQIIALNNKVIIGSADLSVSNGFSGAEYKVINANDFSGNFIYYGVREHAMAAVMNGLALSKFTPIGGTFFAFSDYMRPAIRLAALMSLPIIFVMSHDSIGVGEDGPTHQPIEHLASFRAMPNINIFRPADFIETKECYEIALENDKTPSIMVVSRQALPQIRNVDGQNLSIKGGYIASEAENTDSIDVTIFATGSEVNIALKTKMLLEQQQISVRVCSVPCFDILLNQGKAYLDYLRGKAKLLVAIEAASSFGWSSIIQEMGLFCGINSFGRSGSADDLYKYFELEPAQIARKITNNLV